MHDAPIHRSGLVHLARVSSLRHAHETFSSSTHTRSNWSYTLLSSLYTRTAFHPWHTGCGRSTCYAVTMVTRNSICLFDGSFACTRHIVEFFLSRFFFSFFYLFILRARVYEFFFYSFNCKCNGLVDFFDNSAISLRFHSRNRCDRVISNERGKGDIKDTFIDREVV